MFAGECLSKISIRSSVIFKRLWTDTIKLWREDFVKGLSPPSPPWTMVWYDCMRDHIQSRITSEHIGSHPTKYNPIHDHIRSRITSDPWSHPIHDHIRSMITSDPGSHPIQDHIRSMITSDPWSHPIQDHIRSRITFDPGTHPILVWLPPFKVVIADNITTRLQLLFHTNMFSSSDEVIRCCVVPLWICRTIEFGFLKLLSSIIRTKTFPKWVRQSFRPLNQETQALYPGPHGLLTKYIFIVKSRQIIWMLHNGLHTGSYYIDS